VAPAPYYANPVCNYGSFGEPPGAQRGHRSRPQCAAAYCDGDGADRSRVQRGWRRDRLGDATSHELGIDLAARTPLLLTRELAEQADVVVTANSRRPYS